jgi:hypothetical protein
MAPAMPQHDTSLLQAALVGYNAELARVNAAIAALEQHLGKRSDGAPQAPLTKAAPAPRKRHRISPEGRARIAAAQRKRWAQVRKSRQVASPGPASAKRATTKKKARHGAKAAKKSVRKALPKRAPKLRKQTAPQVPPAPVLVMAAEGQEPGSGKKE